MGHAQHGQEACGLSERKGIYIYISQGNKIVAVMRSQN